MYDRMQELTSHNMEKIHDAAMDLLKNTGVAFNDGEALEIFKAAGFRTDGTTVFFQESDIQKAVDLAPNTFTVHARNPEKSLKIGEDDFVFLPGYGAPFMMDSDGNKREATMEDYDNYCKLIQTSPFIDMNGWMMVEPSDMSHETVHLDMNLSNMLLCDKPFMGSPVSRKGAVEGIEMATILWGGEKALDDKTVSVSLINSLSPLQFSDEMAGSLIALARANQACVVASLIMAGGSGPVTLDGVLALQNAEILAGITLAQLVRPGVPVIYGSTSSAMDMKTGALSIGAPELSKNIHMTAQMARFYDLPSRSGGGLTDALSVDAQAGAESAFALLTAARGGINFILHSSGILGSYIAMSFEKFLLDEELCGMIRSMFKSLPITDERIDLPVIKSVGIGGQYLTHPAHSSCAVPSFSPHASCAGKTLMPGPKPGKKRIDETAQDKLVQRFAAYERPEIDPDIEKALNDYVQSKKTDKQ